MGQGSQKPLSIFAPAKINLYLHITGRQENGYHLLDSLVTFADIGDQVEITPAKSFSFTMDGPLAHAFPPGAYDPGPDSENLAVLAIHKLAALYDREPDFHLRLTKYLPLAAGIGGGSSDAASAIWGALAAWQIRPQLDKLMPLMVSLGADVPVCYASMPQRVTGIGERLEPIPELAELPVVLVNPGKACPTGDVFANFKGSFREPLDIIPESLAKPDTLRAFLKNQDNDLTTAALKIVPEIGNVLNAIKVEKGCDIARLSGSGATCFGIFANEALARLAAQHIKQTNPDWWVRHGWLGRTVRY